jgi:hypothetical protein
MISRDAHERRHRRGQPPWREIVRSKRGPRHDHHKESQKKPDVPEPDVDLLVVRNPRLPNLSTLNVFFKGKHWLKM